MRNWHREFYLRWIERVEAWALRSLRRFRWALQLLNEEQAMKLGRWRAEAAAWRAWRRVPAYRDFLIRYGLTSPHVSFERLPVMNKEQYVRRYSTEDRCIGGTFFTPGVAIDESSGSTGMPFNWVRGIGERQRVHRTIARLIEWSLGTQPRIAINAFSMGAWATGVNMGEALEQQGVVKSTGPDLEKILHTLEFFGPQIGYLICGYPPFLKLLLDTMLQRRMPLDRYEIHALVGGEGMSEELRRYLLRYFRSCYSGYGASDLEMGVAVETPEAIRIRSLLHAHPTLRASLLSGDHRVPMVFQYNPMTHYLEVTTENELIATLTDSKVLSPRIRYNIGDEAVLFTRTELLGRLSDLGYPIKPSQDAVLFFPYVMVFGRCDQTISIMGANIYPQDVERAVFTQPELAGLLASFMLSVEDSCNGAVHPRVNIECACATPPALPVAALADRIGFTLQEINSDFRHATKEYPDPLRLELRLYGFGKGPFAGRSRLIKNRYLVETRP